MAKPSSLAMLPLELLGLYLRAHPGMVFSLPLQTADSIKVYSDTDWAGCVRTRKCMSGGARW